VEAGRVDTITIFRKTEEEYFYKRGLTRLPIKRSDLPVGQMSARSSSLAMQRNAPLEARPENVEDQSRRQQGNIQIDQDRKKPSLVIFELLK
jgi:hypothetical protein